MQDALPLLCDLSESGVQFFVFHILWQRQRLFHQLRLFRRQSRQPLAQGKGINPAALLSLLDEAGDIQELLRDLLPGLVEAVDGLQDGPVQLVLIQRGRSMAVFRAELQPGDAPPDDPLFPVSGPGASLVWRTALPAHQQFGQGVFGGVFTLLGLARFLHHLPLAGPAGHLLPYLIEDLFRNDGRVIVLHIHHGALSLVFLYRLADTVGGICLLQQGVANVFFIDQDVVDHLICPALNPAGGGNLVLLQLRFDLAQATPVQVAAEDTLYRLRLLRDDLRLTVRPPPVAQQLLVLEGDVPCLPALLDAPDHVFADRLALRLGKAAEQGNQKLAGRCML